LRSEIVGEPNELRVERVRLAFEEKCPKLNAWKVKAPGRTSVLVIESDDSELSNVFGVSKAVADVLADYPLPPDTIVLVESDAGPLNGWVLKEGSCVGNAVPVLRGRRCYIEGTF
jgi:hypothetical protein